MADHDALIELRAEVRGLTTAIDKFDRNVHEQMVSAEKDSVKRDTRIEIAVERINGQVGKHEREIREHIQEDDLVTEARKGMWNRVETMWNERPTDEQQKQRTEIVTQHRAMWNAFTTARIVIAFLLIEQPVMLAVVAWVLKG